jgi:hypothetical protein
VLKATSVLGSNTFQLLVGITCAKSYFCIGGEQHFSTVSWDYSVLKATSVLVESNTFQLLVGITCAKSYFFIGGEQHFSTVS